MSIQRTLSIIKPDATRRNLTRVINEHLKRSGLKVVAQKRLLLTKAQAAKFYEVHAERPFFSELCEYMTSGQVVVQVLQAEDAVSLNRKVMGATNPEEAEAGSIRAEYALNITENSVHGSDSLENARIEIAFFFAEFELVV
ncbi:MAG: nucleoside-diphosphate kinase [Aestuariivita sp.]|nr:nucleoside-diphosphate kinase [Aestuariivita sp.]MCY4200993.1 nucleoside-diphosphate kinase [Aestuariivita sp.]MCY4287843.1 nucleoside-diphosphate kinase [Aestuariivita sp.]MCY4345296.1 nucleoside-diphosphate kinase [Aestuariivita sp.]